MNREMCRKIVKHLEKHGVVTGHRWKAELIDGLVYVSECTGDRQKWTTRKKMTWDTFEHFFLRNR